MRGVMYVDDGFRAAQGEAFYVSMGLGMKYFS